MSDKEDSRAHLLEIACKTEQILNNTTLRFTVKCAEAII